MCAVALLFAQADLAFGGVPASVEHSRPAQKSTLPPYEADGNTCARTIPERGGGGGRDIIGASGNSAVVLKIKNQGDPVVAAYYKHGRAHDRDGERKGIAAVGRIDRPQHKGAAGTEGHRRDRAESRWQEAGRDRWRQHALDHRRGNRRGDAELQVGDEEAFATPLAFSDDGRFVASAHGLVAYVWDVATGKEALRTTPGVKLDDESYGWGHVADILSLQFTPNGQALLTGGTDSVMRMWDLATGEHLRCYGDEYQVPFGQIDIASDGRQIAAIPFGGGSMTQWDAHKGGLLRITEGPNDASLLSVAYSPDITARSSRRPPIPRRGCGMPGRAPCRGSCVIPVASHRQASTRMGGSAS